MKFTAILINLICILGIVSAKDIEISISKKGLIKSIGEIAENDEGKRVTTNLWMLKQDLTGLSFYLFWEVNDGSRSSRSSIYPADPEVMKFIIAKYLNDPDIGAESIYNEIFEGKWRKDNLSQVDSTTQP